MTNRLSHSQATKFQDCAQSWHYHYVEKLRPVNQSAALLFGSAVDHALTAMMKQIKENSNEEKKSPEEIFNYFWRFQDINGKNTYLPNCTNIVYSNSDFDADLLSKEFIEKVCQEYSITNLKEEIKKLYDEKEYLGFDGLPQDRKKLLNHINWGALYTKGHLMIKEIREQILPKIKKVLGVQCYVKLENKDGDAVIGYADLVCEFEGYDKPIIIDFKTSSRNYDTDSVLVSPQLALYVHSLSDQFDNTRYAGFIVMHKQVRKNKKKICSKCNKDGSGQRHKTCDAEIENKRCNGEWTETIDPSIFIQTIINAIPERTEEIVMDNLDFVNQSIKTGVITRSFSSCIKGWGRCTFYNLCYFNNNKDLIKV